MVAAKRRLGSMNIILVIFDSLRKDCVHCYGNPPWWEIKTPHWDALAKESLVMDRAYPEALPTLPARRSIYTGRRVYPFWNGDFRLKGDFVGAPGWGPIPEDQPTLAEILYEKGGYRTALIADVYHMFKPSKNYARGFQQWMFLRGQEVDPARSGPPPTRAEIEYWLPEEVRNPARVNFIAKCLLNMRDRVREEDYFAPRVLIEASRWLEQNRDAEKFFLVVIRHPQGVGAGKRSNHIVQHHDIAKLILDFAGVPPPQPVDGVNFWDAVISGGKTIRDHATIAWGSAVTVVSERWWYNGKVNGSGVFLHDLAAPAPFAENVAAQHPDIVNRMHRQTMEDAGGRLPGFLLKLAEKENDAPGCSELVART